SGRTGGGAAVERGADVPEPWAHDDVVHAWWVEPGRVLAGEYPASRDDRKATARKVELLVDAGVRTFVDLTEEGELDPYAPVVDELASERSLELRHHRFAIRDLSALPEDSAYDAIVNAIRR